MIVLIVVHVPIVIPRVETLTTTHTEHKKTRQCRQRQSQRHVSHFHRYYNNERWIVANKPSLTHIIEE